MIQGNTLLYCPGQARPPREFLGEFAAPTWTPPARVYPPRLSFAHHVVPEIPSTGNSIANQKILRSSESYPPPAQLTPPWIVTDLIVSTGAQGSQTRGAGVARAWRGRLPLRDPPRGKGTLRYKQFNSNSNTNTNRDHEMQCFPWEKHHSVACGPCLCLSLSLS